MASSAIGMFLAKAIGTAIIGGIAQKQFGGGAGGGAPAPAPTPVPKGPAPDLATFERPEAMMASPTLGMSSSMTPLQQRTAIATQGVAGTGGASAQEYYKNLAMRSMVGEGGEATGEFLPIEQQYVEQVLGQNINKPDSTASFLSALMRG